MRLRTGNLRRKRKLRPILGRLYYQGKLLGIVTSYRITVKPERKRPAIRATMDDISSDSLAAVFGFDVALEPDFSASGEMIGMSVVPKS